jgi:RNA polymerase sigma-70 factor (ECF subfamily)
MAWWDPNRPGGIVEPGFDAAWRARALDGDEAAVARLTGTMLVPLYRFVFYRVGRRQDLCEEVVQETLLRALRDLARYEPERAGGDIGPWLRGLAKNEVRRVLGRERPAARLEAAWDRLDEELVAVYARLESAPLDADALDRQETRDLVNATMAQLPDQHRVALEAKYVQGLSVRAIADAWRLSEKAVESRLSRAREAFRATFLLLTRDLDTAFPEGTP